MCYLLLAIVLAATVSCASGSVQPAPPAIPPTAATPLPCPAHPTTTLDMEGCGERDLLETDRAINARAKRIFGLLRPSDRTPFVRSERLWLRYRDTSCSIEASKYEGGSLQPVIRLACQVTRNKDHLEDFAGMESAYRFHG